MNPRTLQAAMQHHGAGRLAAAERLYREVLLQDPNHDAAAFLLGVLALESGRPGDSVETFTRAAALAPENAVYHANLGEAQRRLGHFAAAIDSFLKAMSLKRDLVAPVYNLGLLLQDCSEIDGAIACFEHVVELSPDLPDVHQRLASARQDRRRQPARHDDQLRLRLAAAYGVLGAMRAELHRVDEAIASYRRALELEPDRPELHAILGNALCKAGLVSEAIASFRRAVALRPDDPDLLGNLVYSLHFHPGYDARAILREARSCDRVFSPLRPAGSASHDNDRAPDRRLRIGYVSPDFREHCQALFLTPLLKHHDHGGFEIFCYSNVLAPDALTDRLLGHADQWRNIAAMDDSTAAALIRADRIDVLVDLTMHMERNRLGVFARKPAPIQVCWLAYPGTTGLSSMDYRVTDPFLDPPESDTEVYAERSLRLPESFWCYDPLIREDGVSPLPAREDGRIRFGCLNNFCKVNDAVIDLWARAMREVDGSRLVLLAPLGGARSRTLAAFEKHGIDAARIECVGFQPRREYLAAYRGIDLCLDTFPYNGHTTSLDAFWMGVPVVTLVGATVVGRAGLCQAKNLGLPELVARTPDEYVKIAVGLCKDIDRLSELRAGMRARMESSPLMDAPRFARNLEAAYRSVWRQWCEAARP